MSDGGKGSRPRPFSVDRKTFEDNWDRIFGKSKIQEEINQLREFGNRASLAEQQEQAWLKNEYQDILSTEDCVLSVLEKLQNSEKQQEN